MDNKPAEKDFRKWYKKKRYIIPMGLFGLVWLSGGFDPSASDTSINYTPVVSQIEEQPFVSEQTRNAAPVSNITQPEDEVQSTAPSSPVVTQPAKKIISSAPVDGIPLSNNNTYINSQGNEVHSPAYAPSVPTGASAICRDGTYSFSQNRRGTCSHHGGVSEWLN